MIEIKLLEKAIKDGDAGEINPTLMTAYSNSKEQGLDEIDFDTVIWQEDIEPIINTCRAEGIQTFTISASMGCLLDVLGEMQARGCRIEGMKKVVRKYLSIRSEKTAIIIRV